jgi:hypothetical protein
MAPLPDRLPDRCTHIMRKFCFDRLQRGRPPGRVAQRDHGKYPARSLASQNGTRNNRVPGARLKSFPALKQRVRARSRSFCKTRCG